MNEISRILVKEGILKADNLEDKLVIVARAVSKQLNAIPEGILYEMEVTKALAQIRKTNNSKLNETDINNLSKPAKNIHYQYYGVQTITLRDAIGYSLQNLHREKPFEVRFNENPNGQMQQFSFRVILYKDDEKLKRYILSRTSPYPKVVYTFSVPDEIITKKNGLRQRGSK